jgi:hypothetical protein
MRGSVGLERQGRLGLAALGTLRRSLHRLPRSWLPLKLFFYTVSEIECTGNIALAFTANPEGGVDAATARQLLS